MNIKKQEQLGMPLGTASNRLKKSIMLKLLKLIDQDYCYRCGAKIETEKELSIEHITPWLDSDDPKELFFNLDNISFSHLKCNIAAARRITGISHPSEESYRRGCRCSECREIQKLRRRDQRNRGIKT